MQQVQPIKHTIYLGRCYISMGNKSSNNSNIRIIHHLANGEIRNTMKGYKVPINDRTIEAYRILAGYKNNKT